LQISHQLIQWLIQRQILFVRQQQQANPPLSTGHIIYLVISVTDNKLLNIKSQPVFAFKKAINNISQPLFALNKRTKFFRRKTLEASKIVQEPPETLILGLNLSLHDNNSSIRLVT
jgi:hypothetical protein